MFTIGCKMETGLQDGWTVRRYRFTTRTPVADDMRIERMEMTDISTGERYITAVPDSLTNTLRPGAKEDITFCLGIRYDGVVPNKLDEIVLDMSALE